jgi:peptidoglycan hydrolase-like protein with peptidoglycan-binding domain
MSSRFASIPARLLSAACALLLLCALGSAETGKKSSTTGKKTTASAHTTSRKGKRSRRGSWRRRGQQKIEAQRTREIQEALIREHYMQGKASGVWDAASQKAMERYQADNGWQSKTVPDSRALIKLGLGPDHEHLLNPESAMTSAPVSTPATKKDAADSSNPPQR